MQWIKSPLPVEYQKAKELQHFDSSLMVDEDTSTLSFILSLKIEHNTYCFEDFRWINVEVDSSFDFFLDNMFKQKKPLEFKPGMTDYLTGNRSAICFQKPYGICKRKLVTFCARLMHADGSLSTCYFGSDVSVIDT